MSELARPTCAAELNAQIHAMLPGASVDDAAFSRLLAYVSLRGVWCATHNLSGPRAQVEVWTTDILDALTVLPLVDVDLPLIDVGSGNGIPGLILAAVEPRLRVRLVEPRVKRAAFLRSAVTALGLNKTCTVERKRWPVPLANPVQVISRAVVPADIWPGLAAAGGPQVEVILRMLARERPEVSVDGFALELAREYELPGGAMRLVERWSRHALARRDQLDPRFT